MRALALDFDGVIADSSRECFVVALRAYVALRPGTSLGAALPSLEAVLASGAGAVERHPLFAPFVALMPLGNRAEDFGAALEALARCGSIADQVTYDSFFATLERDWLDAFHRRFYVERERFAAADPVRWLGLQPAYREVVELLVRVRRRGEVLLAVATAKDRASVEALLDSYGLAGVFPPEAILDKETGVSKVAHLERLHERLGVTFADMTFVDDKVRHLDAVAGLGVRCALAGWGYNSERERAAARSRGYLVATLADVEALLCPAGMI
jgi:phosphoglycolate phosphatase-like HAD superfamily hydrolase